jgi:phosphoserine / homoserine phosphotransferase
MKVAEALQSLNYKVIAIGDSYNDLSMLRKADHGLLFNAPQKVIDENSDLMVINSFDDLKQKILEITDN